MDLKQILIIFT